MCIEEGLESLAGEAVIAHAGYGTLDASLIVSRELRVILLIKQKLIFK